MSYKIKILNEQQYSSLISEKDSSLKNEKARLYLTTVLPGLFYCVTDKLLNFKEENFLYIPPQILGIDYTPEIFDTMVYKKFELNRAVISIDGKAFMPITGRRGGGRGNYGRGGKRCGSQCGNGSA